MCMRKTSCSFRRQCAGQATVEAAVLIPSVMLLLGILVQPVCLLYTRAVMHGTAAETARAVLTARGAEDLTECEQYARRRLAAVPEVSVLHVGGTDDWQIGVAQGDDGRVASVTITGHARPLPLFSLVSAPLAERDGTGLVLHVEVKQVLRPSWLGGSYGDWLEMWG